MSQKSILQQHENDIKSATQGSNVLAEGSDVGWEEGKWSYVIRHGGIRVCVF